MTHHTRVQRAVLGAALKLRRACRHLVHSRVFLLGVFFFIIFSLLFLLLEMALFPPNVYTWVHLVNDVIGLGFVLELLVRWIAIGHFRPFIREYWLDVLAAIPMLPLRFLRFFRLLRLLRLLSMLVFMRRHLRVFLYLFRKRFLAAVIVCLLTVFVIMFCSIAYVHFEMAKDGADFDKLGRSFWIVVFSLVSDQYSVDYPASAGGKFILVLVMFTGMALFAIMTGAVAARYQVIANAIREGTILGKHNFSDMERHVVVCGFNEHVPVIIAEMQRNADRVEQSYVVVSEMEHLPDMSEAGVDMASVYHVNRDFAHAKSLEYANVAHASTAVILADLSRGRNSHDADARSVLTAMTVEKMNPAVYTCVELMHEENRYHLEMSKVDSVILSGSIASHLIAQTAIKRSTMPIYSELFQMPQGNQFHEVPFPRDHVGRTFEELVGPWKKENRSLLVGVLLKAGKVRLNPEGYEVADGDRAIVIAREKPHPRD